MVESEKKRKDEEDHSAIKVYKKQKTIRTLSTALDTQEPGTQSVSAIHQVENVNFDAAAQGAIPDKAANPDEDVIPDKAANPDEDAILTRRQILMREQILTKEQLLMRKQILTMEQLLMRKQIMTTEQLLMLPLLLKWPYKNL